MLQSDLDSLGHGANTWQLRFNEEKCEAMCITHSRDNSCTDYTLSTTLKDIKSFKDLGVEISKDLPWSQHISTIVNKANQVLGLIRRTVGTANTCTFSPRYKSLVRQLEYAVPVWNPYLIKGFHAIENVQHRASRLALPQKRGELPYKERCNILNWPILPTCTTYFSLVECYKIVFGLSHLNFQEFSEFATVHSTRANHSYKLFLKSSKINCFKHNSFFIRVVRVSTNSGVVNDWNSLSKDIVEAGTLELFKSRLKSFLKL